MTHSLLRPVGACVRGGTLTQGVALGCGVTPLRGDIAAPRRSEEKAAASRRTARRAPPDKVEFCVLAFARTILLSRAHQRNSCYKPLVSNPELAATAPYESRLLSVIDSRAACECLARQPDCLWKTFLAKMG